jgi:hypothetical protein
MKPPGPQPGGVECETDADAAPRFGDVDGDPVDGRVVGEGAGQGRRGVLSGNGDGDAGLLHLSTGHALDVHHQPVEGDGVPADEEQVLLPVPIRAVRRPVQRLVGVGEGHGVSIRNRRRAVSATMRAASDGSRCAVISAAVACAVGHDESVWGKSTSYMTLSTPM